VERLYKNMVILLALIYVFHISLPLLWPYLYSEQTQAFLDFGGIDAKITFTPFLTFVIPGLYVICCIGLYKFSSVARTGFTILIFLNLTIGAFCFGFSASVYLDTAAGYFLSLLEGGILVMIYLSKISRNFSNVRSN
jgi:hypothetical protein